MNKQNMIKQIKKEYINRLPSPKSSWPTSVKKSYLYICANIFHSDLTIFKLRYEYNLKTKIFPTLFRKNLGKNPKEFIQYHRMECSMIILDSIDDITMIECALSVGIDKPSTFSKAFKKHTGSNPSSWKSAHYQ